MTPFALYSPGTSLLHRAPAGPKLLVVALVALATVLLSSPAVLAALALLVAVGYAVARVPWRRVLPLVRLLVVLVAVVLAVQAWLVGPRDAVVTCLRIVAALGAATLFTLTTRIDALVDAVERGLRAVPVLRRAVPPERVGLLVGLTVAAVAVLTTIAGSVREAARARGADRSATAFVVPFLVRTLRYADELGEALAARGVGDEESG